MTSIACPRCGADCDRGHCPACGLYFDPHLAPTPDRGADDRRLLDDVNGSLRSEQYRIDGLLAIGGMGVVLQGRRLRDDLPILVKAPRHIDERAANRFAREARALATCDHPYIPTLIDIDVSRQNRPLLVLEYLPGRNLRLLFETGLSTGDFERIVRSCCEALDHSHRRGVVHRDVKPENIVVGEDRCLLVDFGLALVDERRPADLGPHVPRITPQGSLLGTPPYTAPEQLREPHRVDGRADIYALGVVVGEAIERLHEVDQAWIADWRAIAARCCETLPDRRPSLQELIARCRTEQRSGQRPVVPPHRQSRLLLLSIVGGIAAAIVLLLMLVQDAPGRRLSGSIDPVDGGRITLEIGRDGSLRLTPGGDTRVRLPGGGAWRTDTIDLRGRAGETVMVQVRAPDGGWELSLE